MYYLPVENLQQSRFVILLPLWIIEEVHFVIFARIVKNHKSLCRELLSFRRDGRSTKGIQEDRYDSGEYLSHNLITKYE